jgi:hypothetical protein
VPLVTFVRVKVRVRLKLGLGFRLKKKFDKQKLNYKDYKEYSTLTIQRQKTNSGYIVNNLKDYHTKY